MGLTMVKIHCDRCGGEIKNEYYTINLYKYDVNPQGDIYDWATTASCAASYTRDSALQVLNAQKMYCDKCKNEIEKFINME